MKSWYSLVATLRMTSIRILEYCKGLFITCRKDIPEKIVKMGQTEEKAMRSCETFGEIKLISVSPPNKPGSKCVLFKLRSQLIF